PGYMDTGNALTKDLVHSLTTTVQRVEEAMDKMQFSVALESIWQLVGRTNKYIDETLPWNLAKEEAHRDELGSVLYHLAESLRYISILIQPFMTRTPQKIWTQ